MEKRFNWQGLIIPVFLVSVWFIISLTKNLPTQLFPAPWEVVRSFWYLFQKGLLWDHVATSFLRVFAGFGLAALVGIPFGLLLGAVPKSDLFCGPILHFLRQIPPTAWIPLFLLWFGIGEGVKYAVIFYAAVFPIIINTALGVQQIPEEYKEVAEILCLSPAERLRTLLIPGSYHAILTGLRLGMGMGWRAIVAAEMIASTNGIGHLILASRSLARVDEMVLGILLIGLIGMGIDFIFVRLQKCLIPCWRLTGVKREGEEYENAPSAVGASF